MFKRLKNKIKNKLNNYFNNLLDPKLNDINNKIDLKKDETINDVRRLIKASIVNRETFGPYKDYCKGKKLVICGAGPSLNKYKPIPGAIHIALNRAFLFDKVHFDFIFCHDFFGIKQYFDDYINYKNCIKFLGDFSQNMNWCPQPIESYIRNKNIKKFIIALDKHKDSSYNKYFEKDIDLTDICDLPQVGLVVLQFALFMNPDEIFLVGYDQIGGHFANKNSAKTQQKFDKISTTNYFIKTNKIQKDCWSKFLEFKNYHYPNVKIYSINPVGLKGLFNDLYQK